MHNILRIIRANINKLLVNQGQKNKKDYRTDGNQHDLNLLFVLKTAD